MELYNSRNTYYKSIFGAIPQEQEFIVQIAVPQNLCLPSLVLSKDNEVAAVIPMEFLKTENGLQILSCKLMIKNIGVYFYHFAFDGTDLCIYNQGKGIGFLAQEGQPFQLTVYAKEFSTPSLVKGSIFYQIFPDRFFEAKPKSHLFYKDRIYIQDKSSLPCFTPLEDGGGLTQDYFGGDLSGIIEKLDYLENLGISYIYLNPIFEAHANHRYNTADYFKIDPDLGTLEDFRLLCNLAKQHHIKIILDGVFSHTGSDSIYFNKANRYSSLGAYQSAQSPYRLWYDFDKKYSCGYRSWWGFETLPELNEMNPSFLEYICGENGVLKFWLDAGASGFRLDVADELPDEFIEAVRKCIKKHNPQNLLIGEVWEDATTKISYGKRRTYLLGNGLDSTMNYPFRQAILEFMRNGNGDAFCESIIEICENYPPPALHTMLNSLSTHDTMRAITYLGAYDLQCFDRAWQAKQTLSSVQLEIAKQKLICAYALLYFLPGIPCIYYGDETALQGYQDPFNRRYFPWWELDNKLVSQFQALAKFRANARVFCEGKIHFVHSSFACVAFVRYSADQEVLIAVNQGEKVASFSYQNTFYTLNAREYFVKRIK